MTVAELIEKLKAMPQYLPVKMWAGNEDDYDGVYKVDLMDVECNGIEVTVD